MRAVLSFILFLALPLQAVAHKDRIERVRTITVEFKSGESIAFSISGDTVLGVNLNVGSTEYVLPAGECAKLHDVRFETVSLLWDGTFDSAAKSNNFIIRFSMGAESERAFGELPEVQLGFAGKHFVHATVSTSIGPGSRQIGQPLKLSAKFPN